MQKVYKSDPYWTKFKMTADGISLQRAYNDALNANIPEDIINEMIQRQRYPERYPTSYRSREDELLDELLEDMSPRTPQLAPEPYYENKETEVKDESKAKRKPKAFNRQSHEKKQWKLDLVAYFNRSKLNRRTGFTADQLRSSMTTLITTRTLYNYLEELYKEGEIKRWRQAREAGEQIAYRHWYSSLDNPDPRYVKWVDLG